MFRHYFMLLMLIPLYADATLLTLRLRYAIDTPYAYAAMIRYFAMLIPLLMASYFSSRCHYFLRFSLR